VSTGRLEAVLVGDPVDTDDGTIFGRIRVTAAHHRADALRILGVDLLLGARLGALDAVFGREVKRVTAILVGRGGRAQNGDRFRFQGFALGRQGGGDGQKGGDDELEKNELLEHFRIVRKKNHRTHQLHGSAEFGDEPVVRR